MVYSVLLVLNYIPIAVFLRFDQGNQKGLDASNKAEDDDIL